MNDTERIAGYYDRLVERYGYSPLARDSSRESLLEIRYRVLSEVLDLSGKRVLEVGCGFGDLGKFIHARFKNVAYVGIDISRSMVETGRQIHPNLTLHHADLLSWKPTGQFDVVLAQGIFYLLGEDAENKMNRLVARMLSIAEKAAAFCTLSTWAETCDEHEFHADPLRTLQMCHTLTPHVVLRHDYLPNDFAAYLYPQSPCASGGGW